MFRSNNKVFLMLSCLLFSPAAMAHNGAALVMTIMALSMPIILYICGIIGFGFMNVSDSRMIRHLFLIASSVLTVFLGFEISVYTCFTLGHAYPNFIFQFLVFSALVFFGLIYVYLFVNNRCKSIRLQYKSGK